MFDLVEEKSEWSGGCFVRDREGSRQFLSQYKKSAKQWEGELTVKRCAIDKWQFYS